MMGVDQEQGVKPPEPVGRGPTRLQVGGAPLTPATIRVVLHLAPGEKKAAEWVRVGQAKVRIFIGHGPNPQWRDLKDHLQ